MTDKIDQGLCDQLRDAIQAGLSDEGNVKALNKAIEDISYRIQSDLEYAIKDNMAYDLSGWVVGMAENAVEQILNGNEDQMRRYLSCEKRSETGEYIGWNGRLDGFSMGDRDIARQHPVIHGRLFEQGCVRLRKEIVDAHRDLLVSERILDLEEQVKSLVAQVNKANDEKEQMWQRVRTDA